MKTIKEYMVISNEDIKAFREAFEKCLIKYQNEGYELDIKYSIAVSNGGNLVNSVMILCY